MKNTIPFLFVITGHIDLREEGKEKLRTTVIILLKKYQSKYTELILLSALAESADMLVAEVAWSLGITLHVILPYEESAYLDSFDDESQKERFLKLKKSASKVKTLTCDTSLSSSKCYQVLGEYLADTSNIK